MKGNIAALLNVEPKQVRVISGNVGGSFGMKAAPYPEYVCVLHAARALGRPVKWTDERSGSFVSDSHGRDHASTPSSRSTPRAISSRCGSPIVGNMGGFLANVGPMPSTQNAVKNVQSVYRTPLIEVSTKCVFTNSTHVVGLSRRRPARGQLLHGAADRHRGRRDGDRPAGAAPAQPHPPARTAVQGGHRAASTTAANFPPCMKEAIEAADAKGFRQRKRESRKRGKLRGLGIGSYLEVTAPPSKELGGMRVRGRTAA